ncbi:hypothetical protein T265_11950 [Opisthorchis viverrini]|uniref:Peptidase C13 family protein n=1 Tax=Opisthorchis viverrini TaxID=6198 RepID=A0A074Z7L4_OPIVI|nr:hypothetical protein T265_11950 [Opisthorchis viverrini]KER19195.1 hypothetical protein T265_11950 [Opisthorchis viverrini]
MQANKSYPGFLACICKPTVHLPPYASQEAVERFTKDELRLANRHGTQGETGTLRAQIVTGEWRRYGSEGLLCSQLTALQMNMDFDYPLLRFETTQIMQGSFIHSMPVSFCMTDGQPRAYENEGPSARKTSQEAPSPQITRKLRRFVISLSKLTQAKFSKPITSWVQIPAKNIFTTAFDDSANNRNNTFQDKEFHDYEHDDAYKGVLTAMGLNEVLAKMYSNKKYNKLVFYMDACYSGSMFHDILPSYVGDHLSECRGLQTTFVIIPNRKERKKRTLDQQEEKVKRRTENIHVMKNGEMVPGVAEHTTHLMEMCKAGYEAETLIESVHSVCS